MSAVPPAPLRVLRAPECATAALGALPGLRGPLLPAVQRRARVLRGVMTGGTTELEARLAALALTWPHVRDDEHDADFDVSFTPTTMYGTCSCGARWVCFLRPQAESSPEQWKRRGRWRRPWRPICICGRRLAETEDPQQCACGAISRCYLREAVGISRRLWWEAWIYPAEIFG